MQVKQQSSQSVSLTVRFIRNQSNRHFTALEQKKYHSEGWIIQKFAGAESRGAAELSEGVYATLFVFDFFL